MQYLGYYTLKVDGIWGQGTEQAVRDFPKAESLEVDRISGKLTQAALIDAVANGRFKPNDTFPDCGDDASVYLQPDGYYHIPRGVDVQLSRNLRPSEVMCQGSCCYSESIISKRMVDTFQSIQDEYGGPIEIASANGSGFRCPTHNAEVDGSKGSLHLTGDEFDLHAGDKARLLAVCEHNITDGEIGMYSWGVHAGAWDRGFVNRFTGK